MKEKLPGLVPGNNSCVFCHGAEAPKTGESAKSCLDCHDKDMSPSPDPGIVFESGMAAGYRVAMHETCIPCHRKERERVGRPDLAECFHCHGMREGELLAEQH